MDRTAFRLFIAALLVAGIGAGPVFADSPATEPQPCYRCRVYVPCVRRHALPSDTGSYIGYYVGGGAHRGGDDRYPDEGTWGWDYRGWFPRRIVLAWYHGRRYQGGKGAYKTDGPRLLERHHERHHEHGEKHE